MKSLLVVLAGLFFLPVGLWAQNGFYGQHAPFFSYSNLDIYQEVPDNFLFLVDDDFQKVLANPAKSGLYQTPFTATTLENGANVPINAGIVLPGNWVITVSHLNSNTTGFSESDVSQFETISFVQGLDLVTETQSRTDRVEIETNDAFNSSELRVIKTWKNRENDSRAFGTFLGFTQSDREEVIQSNLFFKNKVRRTRDDSLILQITNDIGRVRDIIETEKRNLLQGGFEYYRASERGESAHKIYLQLTDFDIEESVYTVRRDTIENRTTNATTGRIDVYDEEDRILTDAVPFGISYNGYINRKLNRFGDDFIFLSIGGRYSQGDLNFNLRMLDLFTIYQNGNETFTSSDNLNFGYTGNESILLFGEISPGYAVRVEGDNYNLFTGFNPFFSYTRVEDSYFYVEAAIRETMRSTLHTGARIPFFGSFEINEWLSFWGGGTLQFNHYLTKTEEEQVLKVEEDNTNLPVDFSYSIKNTNNRIQKGLFAGFKLSHKSGLTLNTNVRQNLAGINNWLISVGYFF